MSSNLRPLLETILRLFALYRLEADLGWFMSEEIISPSVGRAVPALIRQLCADLAPHCHMLVASFGIPEYLLQAPIAGDWAEYNAVDNQGEVLGLRF